MSNINFFDLSVKDAVLKAELLSAVDKVLSHGRLILGPEVEELELVLSQFCGRGCCVGVGSGTAALYVALRALNIGPGDEVITTPLSWIATLNAIVLVGATPVFVDIQPDLNMDAKLIAAAITPRTKAVVPVHFSGLMCDMESINLIAEQHGIHVIEDAAQAFGAERNGKRAGAFGTVACFSMNAMKVFHSYGEAGAVLTDDPSVRDKMASLCYNGTVNRGECHYPSLNFRLQTMQASMLLVEFKRLDSIIARRREIADIYHRELQGVVDIPLDVPGSKSVYYTYTIQTDKRDELRDFLATNGIESKIHHPVLMPYHEAYKNAFTPHIPVAERLVKRILSLPNHENLLNSEIENVASCIRKFHGVA
jgi:dTDP-4-amino-4,6-dideoxygalactose transaminase